MASNMKTTVEIPDAVLSAARELADREGTSVKSLIEAGLRHEIATRSEREAFKLRRATFKGEGLQPGVADASWERLRELAYEGHGG